MTQAAISYQIKILEERVGAPLFLRGPRGVTLTRRRPPPRARRLRSLRAAPRRLRGSARNRRRTSSRSPRSPPSPPTGWCRGSAPSSSRIRQSRSGSTSPTTLVDFAREDVDVGIRSGSGDMAGPRRARAVRRRLHADAEPAAPARSSGRSKTPADLLKLPLIDPDRRLVARMVRGGRRAQRPICRSATEMRVQNQQLAGRAALAGQGVAILMPAFFAEELADRAAWCSRSRSCARSATRTTGWSIRRRAAARRRSAPSATGFCKRSAVRSEGRGLAEREPGAALSLLEGRSRPARGRSEEARGRPACVEPPENPACCPEFSCAPNRPAAFPARGYEEFFGPPLLEEGGGALQEASRKTKQQWRSQKRPARRLVAPQSTLRLAGAPNAVPPGSRPTHQAADRS